MDRGDSPRAKRLSRGLLALSIDLDPLGAYHAIHGLAPPPSHLRHHLSRVAIPRCMDLLDRLGLRATFFVVGQDLDSDAVASLLREAAQEGHELGNHTWSHPYGFLDLERRERAQELDACHERIAEVAGSPPVGFRAPGYHIDSLTLSLLGDRGYIYDSSTMSSVPYYLAKLSVMGAMRLRGTRSRSRLHPIASLLPPDRPYRPGMRHPWRSGDGPLMELPAASRVAGIPLVGTFLGGLPGVALRPLGHWLRRRSYVAVELHAIDLVDISDGGLDGLRGRQPGLDVRLGQRLATIEALLALLLESAHGVCLREAARLLP